MADLSKFKKIRGDSETPKTETHIKKEKILIVDDQRGIREELKRTLDEYPEFEVLTAESGEEALDIIKKYEGNLAYVSLDVIMDGITGFETYDLIHKEYPELLAGFCTAFPGQKKTLDDVAAIHGFFGYNIKSGDRTFFEDFRKIVGKAVSIKKQANFEREYKNNVESGKQSLDDLLLIETIIGGKVAAKPFSNNYSDTTLVKDFTNSKKVIGAFVDASDEMVDSAIAHSRKAAAYWSDVNKINDKTYHKLMQRFGDILKENRVLIDGKVVDFDLSICRSNQAAYDIVVNDRKMAAEFASRTPEYTEWALKHLRHSEEVHDNVKTVATFIQSSMYQTGAYGIIEALRARKSLVVKLDSKDPYPQYHVSKAFIQAWSELQEEGDIDKTQATPIQVLAWDTKKHMDRGGKVIRETDGTIFMGNPKNAVLIEHGRDLRDIVLRSEEQFLELSNILREKTINEKVWYFTANKAGAVLGRIKTLESLDRFTDQLVHSVRSHYRSCKRLISLTIDNDWHPDAANDLKKYNFYDVALNMIKTKLKDLKIGPAGEADSQIVKPSKSYMANVNRYLTLAASYGNVQKLSNDEYSPVIIELDTEKVMQRVSGIDKYLSSECMFPVLNITKGGINTAKEVLRTMCSRGDPKNLEASIWTDDTEFFQKFVDTSMQHQYEGSGTDMMHTNQHSYGLYHNEPTTNGFGSFEKDCWKKRGHQLRSLYLEVRKP